MKKIIVSTFIICIGIIININGQTWHNGINCSEVNSACYLHAVNSNYILASENTFYVLSNEGNFLSKHNVKGSIWFFDSNNLFGLTANNFGLEGGTYTLHKYNNNLNLVEEINFTNEGQIRNILIHKNEIFLTMYYNEESKTYLEKYSANGIFLKSRLLSNGGTRKDQILILEDDKIICYSSGIQNDYILLDKEWNTLVSTLNNRIRTKRIVQDSPNELIIAGDLDDQFFSTIFKTDLNGNILNKLDLRNEDFRIASLDVDEKSIYVITSEFGTTKGLLYIIDKETFTIICNLTINKHDENEWHPISRNNLLENEHHLIGLGFLNNGKMIYSILKSNFNCDTGNQSIVNCGLTSTSNTMRNLGVNISPNPSDNIVKLSSTTGMEYNFILTNYIGEVIIKGNFTNSHTLHLKDLDCGYYLLQFYSQNHTFIGTKRIVKIN